jgi:hypothetical protein
MIRRDEAATFAAELVTTAAYAAILQKLNREYEPDWTWLTVVIGVVISTAPTITLARTDPATSWPDYERRTIAGFLTSGLIIIGWQLWQHAERKGHRRGYDMARRILPESYDDADPTSPLE